MSIVSGSGQHAYSGYAFATPLTVSFSGESYVTLDWEVSNSDGSFQESDFESSYITEIGVEPGTTSSVHFYAGDTPGPVQVMVTCVSGCDTMQTLVFSETIDNPPPYLQMQIAGGNNQSGPANTQLSQPLRVNITPTPLGYDGPFEETITWVVETGNATFVENNSTTYTEVVELGSTSPSVATRRARVAKALAAQAATATAHLQLGPTAGSVTVRVQCPDCTVGRTVNFIETITPNTSSMLGKFSGDAQSGQIGTQAAAPLVVTLPNGNGQTITWSVTSGQATLSSNTSTVDANGQSQITFHYGTTPGPIAITASAGSAGQVIFGETALSGNVSVVSGNNQSGTTGSPLQPLVLQVGGASGGASGVTVTWSIVQGSATLASPTTVTDGTGRTSNAVTLGANAGTVVVQASAPGYGTTTFTLTAIAGAPGGAVLTIVSGNNQALIPNQSSQPLVVKLLSGTTPVPGVTIQWSVSGSSGSLDNATTVTDSTGQAQNRVKVVLPAAYTVTAQVANQPTIAPVTFTFNNAVVNLPSLNPGQTGVAHAIDRACPALAAQSNLNAQQQDFLARCSEIVVNSGTNPSQVPGALDAMLNNKTTPQAGLADTVMQGQLTNLSTRLAELRQGSHGFSTGGLALNEDGRSLPASSLSDVFTSYRKDPKESTDDEVGKDFDRWGFFATGVVDRGGASADGMAPGYDFHNASITAGVDYRFNDTFVAGAALGYASNNSDIDANAGNVDVDSYSLNAYFTWYRNNDFYIEGSAVIDWLNYDLSRNILYQIASLSGGTTDVNNTAKASPDGHQYTLSLSVGKDFNREAWTLSPYVRGVYTHVTLDGFDEHMTDTSAPGLGLATSVDGRSLTSELGVLGGRVSRTVTTDWGVLVPNALVEWNHEFKNDPQTVVTRFLADPTQTPIFVTDTRVDQNYFNLGIGLNAILPKGRSGFLYYEHVTGYSGVHENRLSAGIRIEF
ncbi:MAG TPA: autotransporter domain-containing protein [Rudaea sp.]|jgi:outer membrane autotransporter protein|nr:autotransporter domain-containing protein [Rudaea sp.]